MVTDYSKIFLLNTTLPAGNKKSSLFFIHQLQAQNSLPTELFSPSFAYILNLKFCFVLFCFVWFRFVSLRFVSFRFVLCCFVSFRFVSFCFVLFFSLFFGTGEGESTVTGQGSFRAMAKGKTSRSNEKTNWWYIMVPTSPFVNPPSGNTNKGSLRLIKENILNKIAIIEK
jgi:hypothetical protein